MPMPSKFTSRRRNLIIAAIGAGASRRVASELAQIDHSTIGVWMRRGEKAPTGRFGVPPSGARGRILPAQTKAAAART